MKQKRKVKSLLSQRKDRKTSFLTTLLLVLSTILCIGSASLLTSSVFAADPNFINYEGLPNNAEVLYNLKFADPEDLTGDGVADVYVHDNSLYISGTVITSGSSNLHRNIVKTGVNSHILGGENNAVNSENVTVIAGYNNLISGGANSTMLGGINNSYSTGVVSIGGQANEIPQKTYKEGIVLIGGRQNYIDINNYAQRNIFLLGGQKNVPNMTGSNIIIGGSGVEITSNPGEINNIFIFSSSAKNFNAQEGKTFYLNMDNGVGIGTGGVPRGLSVNGALGLSNQEYSPFCNSGNIGVIYSLKGCMIGCTKASLEQSGNPFELLSLNEECKNTLADYISSKNVFYQEEIIPETPSYTGYCTHVNFTGHTVPCSTPSVYQNVIFETSIVDYGECTDFLIKNGENKCVFACEKGYHLGYDNDSTYGGFGTGCYADCRLGSDNELPLKHNQTGTLYDVTTVRCSDGEQCKTCGSHAKNVICKNGTVMEYSGGIILGVIDTSSYKYSECTLRGGYDCPSNGYNITGSTKLKQYFVGGDNMEQVNLWHHVTGALTEDEIEMIRTAQSMGVGLGPKKQNNTIITPNINTIINPKDMEIRESPRWQNVNRSIITSTSTGARGIYQLCKYYNNYKDSPDREGVYKNPNTDCGTPINLYKLIGCTPGYTFTGGTCRPKCESFLTGQKNTYYVYGTILTGYKNRSVSCPNKNCEYAAFKCVDDGGTRGVWEPIAGFVGKKPEDYKYERCDVDTKTCGEGFVLQAGDLERFKNRDFTGYQNSIYTGCTIIERNNGNCETGSTYYKLDGCKTNYHTENNEYCIYNYRPAPCSDKVNLPDNAARVHESPRERNHITLVPGQYGQSWDEDAWSSDIQPPDACKWKCIDGYSYNKTTKKCEKNECYGDEPSNAIFVEGSDQNLTGRVQRTLYASESEAAGKPCAYVCNGGYSYSGSTHKCEKNVCFGAKSNWVLVVGSDENLEKNTKAQLYPSATAAGNNPCAYTCGNLYYDKGVCSNISSICGDSPRSCHVGIAMNYNSDDKYYKWDCGYDEIIYQNCSVCKNGSPNNETCNACGNELYQCYGNVNPTNFQENENSYTWECDGLTCSGAREVLPPEPLKIGTIYKWKYVGPGSSNLKSCTSSTGFNKGGYCFVINEQCVDNSGKMYRCLDSTSWSGYCKGGIYNYDNNTEKIEYRSQYNGFGSFNNFGSVMYDYHPNPLDLCLPSRTTELDSCKVIDGCYKATSSCRSTEKGYFQAKYNLLENYYPECDCERSCLDENSIYKGVKKDFYCKCGTRKDSVYKAVLGSNCSNTPMIDGCSIEKEKSYDVYLSGTVVYNEKDKKILGDTYNQKCGIYDTVWNDEMFLPIVTGNDNKLVGYLKCPTTVDGQPAYIYQDGTHSKIN